ncbi:uncharacterized protein K460DRAFT_16928 [Cucurbitaria berberidis CBS 394.84]|uniref:Uncharacterized protein n=1 Tax=Cucurbitaria berberidis CBS 394.84 TaxID=1168544 RepID=A0A9P4LCY7_9PLEO|nr:uncharacterized protein K460DRAFT_16928 [Cucurbitaria berberidis CBS 394.84]KAF1850505.1 hypothetical protein K460DRAFT_16928 [Cucurbitaria berberidis CBS 394.84]
MRTTTTEQMKLFNIQGPKTVAHIPVMQANHRFISSYYRGRYLGRSSPLQVSGASSFSPAQASMQCPSRSALQGHPSHLSSAWYLKFISDWLKLMNLSFSTPSSVPHFPSRLSRPITSSAARVSINREEPMQCYLVLTRLFKHIFSILTNHKVNSRRKR